MPTADKHILQFGFYQLDRQCGELRKNGIGLKLHGQAVQILTVLLEKPGQLVTREELRQRLWASDTFVDFDHSLNAAVKKLRQVLGDDAEKPSYIETLPKRGYRFIAQVSAHPSEFRVSKPPIVEVRNSGEDDSSLVGVSAPEGSVGSDGDVKASEDLPGAAQRANSGESRASNFQALGYILALLAIILLFSVLLLRVRNKQDLRPVRIVQFTSLPGFESRPSFSPDGTQIVFSATGYSDQWDIYVKAIGDEKVSRLTSPPGASSKPKWSPDGRSIAYEYWNRSGAQSPEHELYMMTPLGGGKHKVRGLSDAWDGVLSWSADSNLLAYGEKPAGERSGIFLVPITGSPAQRLTMAPEGMFDGSPAFSPDGNQIAFVRTPDEGGRAELRLVSVAGHAETKLATLDRSFFSLAWTPDGRRIIFSASGLFIGESALYSEAATGGEPQRLSIISSDAGAPAISRQGDKLAYVTSFFDTNIWEFPLKEGDPPIRRIASSRMEMQAAYSPDGRRLAYVSNRDGTLAIWTCNADGTDEARLVSVPAGGGTPVWSPDGKQIAFDSNQGGHWNILVMAADGSNPMRVTDDSSDHRGPSWSANGEWIYFGSNQGGTWQIWKSSVRNRESLPVTSHGGSWAQESPDGKFLYYLKPKFATKYDFPMPPEIWRMPVAGGAETVIWRGEDPHPADSWFWRVTHRGIYLVDNAAKPKPAIKFLDLKTRAVHRLRQLEKPVWGGPGLAISPDEQTALITQVDGSGSDIMIVDNFQ